MFLNFQVFKDIIIIIIIIIITTTTTMFLKIKLIRKKIKYLIIKIQIILFKFNLQIKLILQKLIHVKKINNFMMKTNYNTNNKNNNKIEILFKIIIRFNNILTISIQSNK